jgi:hypothetical protein
MSDATPAYPFMPRSNWYLRPGQFWGIKLSDGRYAAGRVMAVPASGSRDSVGVVVGLMDWVGAAPPTAADLSGRPVLEQAKSNFEAIANTGSEVLGLRPLEADGLIAIYPYDGRVGASVQVWGSRSIAYRADRAFHVTVRRTYEGRPPIMEPHQRRILGRIVGEIATYRAGKQSMVALLSHSWDLWEAAEVQDLDDRRQFMDVYYALATGYGLSTANDANQPYMPSDEDVQAALERFDGWARMLRDDESSSDRDA